MILETAPMTLKLQKLEDLLTQKSSLSRKTPKQTKTKQTTNQQLKRFSVALKGLCSPSEKHLYNLTPAAVLRHHPNERSWEAAEVPVRLGRSLQGKSIHMVSLCALGEILAGTPACSQGVPGLTSAVEDGNLKCA